jgi:hypothetical protein
MTICAKCANSAPSYNLAHFSTPAPSAPTWLGGMGESARTFTQNTWRTVFAICAKPPPARCSIA